MNPPSNHHSLTHLPIHKTAGVFFYTYESSKSFLSTTLPTSIPIPFTHSLASAGAELASCLVLTPAEVIKQNAQMLRRSSSGPGSSQSKSTSLEALNMLRHTSGGVWRRLFSGYTALAARNLPFTALQFPLFEGVRTRIWEVRDRDRDRKKGRVPLENDNRSEVERSRSLVETGLVTGLSAAVSGSLAAFVTTPMDVVKTRMMLAAGGEKKKQKQKQPESSSSGEKKVLLENGQGRQQHKSKSKSKSGASGFQVAKEIFRERGIRGLFRGGALRTTWAAFGSGLYLGSYEVAKVWLKKE